MGDNLKCTICGQVAENNKNDFYPTCAIHRVLAQAMTEDFFKKNPDFTKWHLIKK